jgi:MoaA/NifB/PqqE/SkfB family radical SAM enzyme
MAPDLFTRLVDEIATASPDSVVWLHKDGEPLLHPQFDRLLAYATERLPRVHLSTNATLLDEDRLRTIFSTRLEYLRLSVDGFTREGFERVRVGARFDEVVSAAARAMAIRDALGGSTAIGVRGTRLGEVAEAPEAFRAFWSARVDRVEIVPLMSWPGVIHVPDAPEERRLPCGLLYDEMTVAWDGRVVPCCVYAPSHRGSDADVVGDAGASPLTRIWKDHPLSRLREEHVDGRYRRASFCLGCANNVESGAALVNAGGFRERLRRMLDAGREAPV